jgi:hypothetical protein
VIAGCRDNGTGPSAGSGQIVAGLVFAPGDTLTFDAWALDSFNYEIPASHTTPFWKVIAVRDSFAGAGGVTSIGEYPAPGTVPPRADTLRFRFLPSGEIYQYGFIANLVRRREGVRLVPSWDRIAAFSLPTNSTWNVGTADSAGTDTVRGTVKGDQGYFIAALNGVQTAFHSYGVTLISLDIDYTLLVSDSPPAVLLLENLSTPNGNGYVWFLAALRKH